MGDLSEAVVAPMHVPSCHMNTEKLARHLRAPLLALAAAFAGGSLAQPTESEPRPDELSDSTVVVRWSQFAEDSAFALDPQMTDPFPGMRGWTMMYLAMHDALNAIVPTYRQYAFFGADASANPVAAAAQAAHDVMNHTYPARRAENDAELAHWLGRIPDSDRKARGIAIGVASATAIINARANDRMLEPGEYALQDPLEPGDYRLVPPLEFVYRPAFGEALPFGIRSSAEFLPEPPPPLTSRAYADSINETKAFGRLRSAVRSQDQTHFGAWWLEFNEIQWGRIMRQLAETRRLPLLEAARMFALVNLANTDATVAVWHAKQVYDFWRPLHAIQLADTDGNPRTIADTTWQSEHVIPPVQEYPSAHTVQCHAVARTLRSVLGTDRARFATQSTTALPTGQIRSFERLSAAAEECGISRIMAGYHYRFAVDAGARMGDKVAKRIVGSQLLRRCRDR